MKHQGAESAGESPITRSASWMLLWNLLANALMLVSNAYAARCLGAANYGIGAQVQAAVQHAALAYNGGFDTVAVRSIVQGERAAADVVRSLLTVRLTVAAFIGTAWMVVVMNTQQPGPERTAWLTGAVLLILTSLQLSFAFQAIGRLPVNAALTALSAGAASALYWASFEPHMPAGSDLVVLAAVGVVITTVSLSLVSRLIGLQPSSFVERWRQSVSTASRLLARSWRYWLLSLLVFVYTTSPILLLGWLSGDASAGVFRICLTLAAGLELIFTSINSLLLPQLIRLGGESLQALRDRQRQLLRSHAVVGCVAGIAAIFVTPLVFQYLLSAEFASGATPMMLLILARIVVFIGQIYAWGLVALHLDRQLLLATVFGAATSLAMNLLLIPRFAVMGAAWAALASEVVIVSLATVFFLQHSRRLGRSTTPAKACEME